MKQLFVCDTPYQVFNVLNIVFHSAGLDRNADSECRDLFIIDQFKTAAVLRERIEGSKLFDHVYLLTKDDTKFLPVGTKRNIQMSLDFIGPKTFLRKRFANYDRGIVKELCYDEVYGSGAYSTIAAVMKLNPHAKFILYDDGLGSYSDDIIVKSSGGDLNRLFCKIFHVGSAVCSPSYLLVNNVSMCKSTSVEKDKIKALPVVSEKFLDFCNGIFTVNKNCQTPVIWLSQPLDCNEGALQLRSLIRDTLLPFKDSITVRMHPRDLDIDFYKVFHIDTGEDFWELSVLNKTPENLVLIGNYSSAQVTPKMLFDLEPTLLFLFALNSTMSTEQKKQLEDKVEELRQEYRKPEKIFVPQNMKEFQIVLQTITKAI